MELRDGAQPGEPAMQVEKNIPSRATRSNAGVFTNRLPAKLVWANDWSSLMANSMLGRLAGSAFSREQPPAWIAARATDDPMINRYMQSQYN
jgi:hypothetical protein